MDARRGRMCTNEATPETQGNGQLRCPRPVGSLSRGQPDGARPAALHTLHSPAPSRRGSGLSWDRPRGDTCRSLHTASRRLPGQGTEDMEGCSGSLGGCWPPEATTRSHPKAPAPPHCPGPTHRPPKALTPAARPVRDHTARLASTMACKAAALRGEQVTLRQIQSRPRINRRIPKSYKNEIYFSLICCFKLLGRW